MIWLIGILCLIFLIIFHEFGHFIAAKMCGVKVESFSVGFGPILLHKTFHGTDYRLSLIPLGGYCGMKGEKDFQKAIEEKQDTIIADKDSLYGVHPLKRAFIVFNGPFFNFLLAVIAYTIINIIGYSYTTFTNKIIIPPEEETQNITVAKDAGIQSGDKIIYINDIPTNTFADIIQEVRLRPDEDIKITIQRNEEILNFNVHTVLNKQEGYGMIGIMCDQNSKIQIHSKTYSFFPAIRHGFKDTFKNMYITIKSIGLLFKGVNISNSVAGPIRVTEILGSSVQSGFKENTKIGFISLFDLLAIVSISLCIMNLLPIPIFDGSHILFALIETISRKKIKPIIQYYLQFVGIAVILVLLVLGTYGDISYLIKRGAK